MLDKRITTYAYSTLCDCNTSKIVLITEISKSRKSFWFADVMDIRKSNQKIPANLTLAEKKAIWQQARWSNKKQMWLTSDNKRVLPGVARIPTVAVIVD